MRNPLKYTADKTKKGSDAEPKQSKLEYFNLLLYTESTDYNYKDIIETIKTDPHFISYAYITHNKDFYTQDNFDKHGNLLGRLGEKKKDHIHVCVSLRSKAAITDIATWLGIEQRFIEKCKSFDKSLLYLTHRNAENKAPYELEEVQTNIGDYVEYLYNSYEPKSSPIDSLYKYFEESPYPSCGGFLQFYGIEKSHEIIKYWSMIKTIIEEKRARIDKMEDNAMKEQLKEKLNQETIKKLCQTFDKVEVTETGNAFTQYTLNTDGKLDMCGFRVGGDE